MLTEKDVRDLVQEHGHTVNEGRSIKQIIADEDLPRIPENVTVKEGKVSDSVYSKDLVTKKEFGERQIRLMYRSNRISTHDENRGVIPFKDQVIAINHAFMHDLVKDILGSSQFEVPGLEPTSTVIPSENLGMLMFENVLRMYMAESSTTTSLYQHWLAAVNAGDSAFNYSGHRIYVDEIAPNGRLLYLMDTPSTKDKKDTTIDPKYLFDEGICSEKEYRQIINSSAMAFGVVSEYCRQKGMVLVDIKTEHGDNDDGEIVSGDELFTMESGRFWKLNDDGTLYVRDNKPVSYSKEFGRGMIVESGQQFTKEQSKEIAVRFIQGLQHLTGEEFVPDLRPRDERLVESTNLILDYLL